MNTEQSPDNQKVSAGTSTDDLVTGERHPSVPSFRSRMVSEEEDNGIQVICDHRRTAYLQIGDSGTLTRLDSPKAPGLLLRHAAAKGQHPRPAEIREWIDRLHAYAQLATETYDVWLRLAEIDGGIELDVGDRLDTRIRVTAGRVQVLHGDSPTLFYRTPMTAAFCMPAEDGDLRLLDKYLNVSDVERMLLIAWISYALGHPKAIGTTFPVLVLTGGQGCGKTTLCRILQMLIDPSHVGVQTFPANEQELAVAVQLAHMTLYDNVRMIRPSMADALCRVATGGALVKRKLYSDADMVTLTLHGAVVLNTIYPVVDQPDLSQRCLTLTLLPIDEHHRRSENALTSDFAKDYPKILRGLLNLIAGVFEHLPSVEPTSPERLIDFVRWLAAIERHHGWPGDPLQTAYSDALRQGMRDSLEEHPLAAAVMELLADAPSSGWSGTPAELLEALNRRASRRSVSSAEWPQNSISLSKRLKPLVLALERHGVCLRFGRGRERHITITRIEGYDHD